jgi:hypothetical protein
MKPGISPGLLKTLMTIGAAVLGALVFVPQLAHYQAALAALAGALGGSAHVPRPGDLGAIADANARTAVAKVALAEAIEGEK